MSTFYLYITNLGLVCCHGPPYARCPGSGCCPIEISSGSDSESGDGGLFHPDLDKELYISAAESASSFSSLSPSSFFKRVKVLKKLLKGSRLKAAKRLASILDSVVLSNDEAHGFVSYSLVQGVFGCLPGVAIIDPLHLPLMLRSILR